MIGITGHKGVLGSILIKKIKEKGLDFRVFNDDITDKGLVEQWIKSEKFTGIFHLAAKVPVDVVSKNQFLALETNVGGSINLASSILKNLKDCWLFYASTSHVYESSSSPIKEENPINPINFYGKTKLMGEEVFRSISANQNKQLKICIGRIFSFYHESQKPPFLYPNIINRLNSEDLALPFKLQGGNNVRDFSNAENIVDKAFDLYKINAEGIFNLGSGEGQKIKDFVQQFSPVKLTFDIDNEEKINYLVADISKYKEILKASKF